MHFLLLLFALFLSSTAICLTECMGSTNAEKFIVYLHGMDTVSPSPQEVANRNVLRELVKDFNIRFALPRATEKCPNNSQQLCWTWAPKNLTDLAKVKAAINSAAIDCFPNRNYTALGFSNGGVAITALLRLCEQVDFKSAIVVGASGSWLSSDPKDLKNCYPKLVSLLGSEDKINQKPVRDLINHLNSLNAPVSLVEYDGGHQLLYAPLAKLLK